VAASQWRQGRPGLPKYCRSTNYKIKNNTIKYK
jgi:hypothetical protein